MSEAGPNIVAPADRRRLGRAWLGLTIVLALHVADEASHDFLGVYNPTVRAIRTRLPFLPLPTFTFGVWLAGLILGIIVLLGLSRFAFRGDAWIRRASYVFAVLMATNGLTHLAGSIHFNTTMPGTWTAPLLLISGAWLFVAARRAAPGHRAPFAL